MNICGVKWAISDGSSSVHAVATPDAHCGDMECVFVALPRYPGARGGRSAAYSRTSESAFGFFCLGGTEARGGLAGVDPTVMVGCGACVAAGCLLGEAVVELGLGACLPVVLFLGEAVAASWEALLVWAAVGPAAAAAPVAGAASG